MASIHIRDRIATIRGPGTLLVASDLHGNLKDLQRMVELLDQEEDGALLLLGDLFHGPSVTREEWEILYAHLADYYPDESAEVFRTFARLLKERTGRVTSLLGNHDHAHVGGPVVSKFYDDEAAAMEMSLDDDEIPHLQRVLSALPLIAVSDSRVAFTHAAPPDIPFDAALLASVALDGYSGVPLYAMHRYDILGGLLWTRGATEVVTRRFLSSLAAAAAPSCNAVVHGHEIIDTGFDVENKCRITLSTSFGMKAPAKTSLRLDLGTTYLNAVDLVSRKALLPLYP